MPVSVFQPIIDAINRLTAVVSVFATQVHGDLGTIHTDLGNIEAQLAQLVTLMTPPPVATKLQMLIGGQKIMGIAIVHDADHETLSVLPTDDAGQPTGPLDPTIVVTWAIVTDPSATPPSVSLTPNTTDHQTAVLMQLGQLVTGVVISASATLPPATTATTVTETFNVVAGPASTFAIEVSAETHN